MYSKIVEEHEKILNEQKFFEYILKNSIFGVDIDRNATLLCSYNLLKIAKLQNDNIQLYGFQIKVGDSLKGPIFDEKRYFDETRECI